MITCEWKFILTVRESNFYKLESNFYKLESNFYKLESNFSLSWIPGIQLLKS